MISKARTRSSTARTDRTARSISTTRSGTARIKWLNGLNGGLGQIRGLGLSELSELSELTRHSRWNVLNFRAMPILGLVGGHCIGVDPYYLTNISEKLGYHSQIIPDHTLWPESQRFNGLLYS